MRKFYLVLTVLFIGLISCEKENVRPKSIANQSIPAKPLAEQYPIDLAILDKFLDEYAIEYVSTNLDISFVKIPTPNANNLLSIRNQTDYPLQSKTVILDNVAHKIYYLSLRNGTQIAPTNQSIVYMSYKGLTTENNIFDQNDTSGKFVLTNLIKGFQEIIPLFKSGVYVLNSDKSVRTSTDYGAGVMFLPSALGYYDRSNISFPAYSPLIFTFKLRHVE